jgi:hypothetical protein
VVDTDGLWLLQLVRATGRGLVVVDRALVVGWRCLDGAVLPFPLQHGW